MEKHFSTLREKIAFEKQERIARHSNYADTIEKAIKAGLEAGRDCRPLPMYVLDRERGMARPIEALLGMF